MTQWPDLLRESTTSLLAHRLRAGLAGLGILTGVGTITAVLAIGDGARRQAMDDVGRLGIDNVIVRSNKQTLDRDDAHDIARQFPRATIATLRSTRDVVAAADRSADATIAGVTPVWATTADLAVSRGRWLTRADETLRTAVIGSRLAHTLFDASDPVGRRILAAGAWRTIVGVLPDSDRSDTSSSTVFVPIDSLDVTLVKNDTGAAVDEIVMRVAAGNDVESAGAAVRALLASRHTDATTFEVIVPQALLRARLRAQRMFDLLLLAVGGLTLIVSGVGILNIMVASVSERTAEIGVRRAFGARKTTIVFQFAAEAGILSAGAGLAGIPIGLAAAAAAAWLAGWPIAITVGSLAIGLILALTVGLGAGLYPALLAARLTPSEALRTQA